MRLLCVSPFLALVAKLHFLYCTTKILISHHNAIVSYADEIHPIPNILNYTTPNSARLVVFRDR